MTIEPLNDFIFIQPVTVENKVGEIILATQNNQTKDTGIVFKIGKDVTDVSGGDKVLYDPYTVSQKEINGTKYVVCKINSIIAKIKD